MKRPIWSVGYLPVASIAAAATSTTVAAPPASDRRGHLHRLLRGHHNLHVRRLHHRFLAGGEPR